MTGSARALVLVTLAAAATGCWDGLFDSSPQPTDREMEDLFARQIDSIAEIDRMSAEDPNLIRIDSSFPRKTDNWGWPRPEAEWGISRERWDRYRELFAKVGCPQGVTREPAGVFLICASRGMLDSGVMKGFARLADSSQVLIVESLGDDRHPRPACKHLRDDWFLCRF